MWGHVKSAVDWTTSKARSAATSKPVAGVAAGTVAVQAAVVPALNLVGFTSSGPAAGSFAATCMSTYAGAVPAGKATCYYNAGATIKKAIGLKRLQLYLCLHEFHRWVICDRTVFGYGRHGCRCGHAFASRGRKLCWL